MPTAPQEKCPCCPHASVPGATAARRTDGIHGKIWGAALGLYVSVWFYSFWAADWLLVPLTVIGPPLFVIWFLVVQVLNLFDSD